MMNLDLTCKILDCHVLDMKSYPPRYIITIFEMSLKDKGVLEGWGGVQKYGKHAYEILERSPTYFHN